MSVVVITEIIKLVTALLVLIAAAIGLVKLAKNKTEKDEAE